MSDAIHSSRSPARPSDEATLHRISTLAAHEVDAPVALSRILDVLIQHFHASSGSIALVNPDTGRLEIETQRGLPDDYRDVVLRLGQGITGWVAFHGKAQRVADISKDPRYVRIRASVRSEIAAPMEENGQVLGVINLDSDVTGFFSDDELALLVRFTGEATAVMQRLWHLQQLREKARQLETLIGVGQSLVSKVEEHELCESITRDALQITRARACGLYLFDQPRSVLRLIALTSPDSPPATSPSRDQDLPLESSAVGSVCHTRKQLELANIRSPEYLDVTDLPSDDSLRSMLASPLVFEGEVQGVLAVFTGKIHRFNNEEKRLCAALASLAAVALQNARLYARVFQSEETLRKNEQLTTLGLLAAEIAHEIRNPLTVIKLLFGNLSLDFPIEDPRSTDVRVIGEKLDQLESIVTRVLQFAKAPASLHARWSIRDIVDDTVVLIRLKLAQAKIHLRFEIPSGQIFVEVHKGQLQQVLLNLFINATQAMPDGGMILVRARVDERGGSPAMVHLDIEDSGNGIPAEIRPRIFDSFLSGRPDGTGLGLAIAKRILASHHGDITLLNSDPSGTTMRITLPLAKS
ncbi:MAG: GAF domain-containing protein [Opitutaceae bacterium]|nr:GAF domain-containing protein [Opitutaceae bacterium]